MPRQVRMGDDPVVGPPDEARVVPPRKHGSTNPRRRRGDRPTSYGALRALLASRSAYVHFARPRTDPEMHGSISSDSGPSLECDSRPYRFGQTKRPRSLKEPISRTKSARDSKQKCKPLAAIFQGIAHKHCRDGK